MEHSPAPPNSAAGGPGAGLDVLLAEDEEHIAKLVAFKLGREGFRVSVARDGAEAVSRLGERRWALVILDVMMPVRDGWSVLREIRSRPALASLPVLMLTAKGAQKDVANAAELGAAHYLKKPFDPGDLAELVKRIARPPAGEGA